MLPKIYLLASLGLPTLALAQSPTPPHGYLGLGVSVYNESVFQSSSYRYGWPTAVGPVLTAGWQFSPRLAVQLSPAVQWASRAETYPGYSAVSGQPASTTYTTDIHLTQSVVPLLLRYTFTAPSARLRVDGLLGTAWLHTGYHHDYVLRRDDSGATLESGNFADADNLALLTLGPAVRYDLGSRLELAVSLPVHYALGQYYSSFSDHLTWQPQLSIQYALGGH